MAPCCSWWALAVVVPLVFATPAPHNEGGLVGARRLAQAQDCRGLVAFSGVAARPSIRVTNDTTSAVEEDASLGTKLGFSDLLTDKSVGWSRESGEFNSICPGLYQFAFSAAGPGTRFTLRKKEAGASSAWKAVASTSEGGGAHVVLLEMEVGDVAALWLTKGELPSPTQHQHEEEGPQSSFSGYRIAKK